MEPAPVSAELIEFEVSKSIAQLNYCLGLLARFQSLQNANAPGPALSSPLLQAAELHAARKGLVAWTNKFNRGPRRLLSCCAA